MIQRPVTVRIAGARDADELFALAWMEPDEWALTPADSRKIRKVIELATTREEMIGPDGSPMQRPTFGVIDGEHGLIGAVGLYPTTAWNSVHFYLRCFFLFVHPAARRMQMAGVQAKRPRLTPPNSHARHLFEFAEWFADRTQTPVVFELLHLERTHQKMKLAERHGRMVGGLFLHSPEAPAAEEAA